MELWGGSGDRGLETGDQSVETGEWGLGKRAWGAVVVGGVVLGVMLLLVFGLNMRRGLNHDEHQFIASAALMARNGLLPYRDFPYFHVPLLSLIYALLFGATDYLLLAARCFSVACSWGTLALLLILAATRLRNLQPGARLLAGSMTALLLMTTPSFLHASGRAWNHDFPILLLLLAATIQCYWLVRRAGAWWLLLTGLLLGLAAATRLSFVFAGIPFFLSIFFVHSWRTRQAWTPAALFAAGALLGSLPAIYLFVVAPGPFIFGNLTYAQLNTAYYQANGSPEAAMSLGQKIYKTLEYTVTQPGNLLLTLLAIFALIRMRVGLRLRIAPDVLFLLFVLPFLLVGAYAPTPIQPQYIYLFFPFLALIFLTALAYDRRPRYATWSVTAAALFAALLAVPKYVEGLEIVFNPAEWHPLKVHARGESLAQLAGGHPVLTMAPIFPLEGKAPIYPEFVTGPMGFRVAPLLNPEARAAAGLVGVEELEADLAGQPPRGVFTGVHDNDAASEEPLLQYAQAHGYVPIALPEQGILWVSPMAQWGDQLQLGATTLPAGVIPPGSERVATFYVQAIAPLARDLNVLVRLVAPDGSELLRSEGWPWGRPTTSWIVGEVWPDGHVLEIPQGAAPGPYAVEMSFYDPATLELLGDAVRVGYVVVGDAQPGEPAPLLARFGDGIGLAGAEAPATGWTPGASPSVRLTWRSDAATRGRYTAFVHLVGPEGLAAQHDQAPLQGFYPTDAWLKGVPVDDSYTLVLPEALPPGEYRLLAGLYDPATGQRLPVLEDGQPVGDAYQVATVKAPAR